MNTLFSTNTLAPHLLRSSPSHSGKTSTKKKPPLHQRSMADTGAARPADPLHAQTMSGRKRKASEEPDHDRMSLSPTASPSLPTHALPAANATTPRTFKRTRTGAAAGCPLPLPRLLETLSAADMRQLLQNVCDQHPELQQEIVTRAPRPSIEATLAVLAKYEAAFRAAFPLGNRAASDYAYNRVRQHLAHLIDALREYTPHFLPPGEAQPTLSLTYLDAVTEVLHRLPDWDSYQHQRHKADAYDEIAQAWALVIREAAKRAGGLHLQFGAWDRKLVEHNQKSGGRLEEAVNELKMALGFAQGSAVVGQASGVAEERVNIRQQLFSGTYGQELGVGLGTR
ncbi:hypothetical protein LTR08_006773 [Meristemomyces frigidus]|nr:hypothetical protein LTR08_006773 [Meristemomyces frigidus]